MLKGGFTSLAGLMAAATGNAKDVPQGGLATVNVTNLDAANPFGGFVRATVGLLNAPGISVTPVSFGALGLVDPLAPAGGVQIAVSATVAGVPPSLDLDRELRLQRFLVLAAAERVILSAHDCSDGGLAVTIAECCFEVGPEVARHFQPLLKCDTVPSHIDLVEVNLRQLLAAFVGVNMLQAAFTGFCPAAIIFRKLGIKAGPAFGCAPSAG